MKKEYPIKFLLVKQVAINSKVSCKVDYDGIDYVY